MEKNKYGLRAINVLRTMCKYACVVLALILISCQSGVESQREVRLLMGTSADIYVESAGPNAMNEAFEAIVRVDDRMSLWHESELRSLNANGSGDLSKDLASVLSEALYIAQVTNGAFDPTVEPLTRQADLLSESNIANDTASIEFVDFRKVAYQELGSSVELNGTTLDLGGIAKGYAVDEAMAVLLASGANFASVSLGQSSLKIYGQERLFSLRDPLNAERGAWASLSLNDIAISTSSLDQQSDHIIDPRIGLVAKNSLSVSVLSTSAMQADALSTAVFVLGADAGIEVLKELGVDGIILSREQNNLIAHTTPGFSQKYNLIVDPSIDTSRVL